MSLRSRSAAKGTNSAQESAAKAVDVIVEDVECATPSPAPFSMGSLLHGLLQSYREALRTAPLLTKSITSATIAIIGEIFGSYISCKAKKEPFSLKYSRLRSFTLYGLLVTGPVLHYWYALLETTMRRMRLQGWTKTLAKLFFDRIIFAPPFVLFTVAFLQFFQHFSPQKTLDYIRTSYWPVLLLNEQVWVVAQAVNFELVPVDYQVLFVNAVAVGWNTLLSMAS